MAGEAYNLTVQKYQEDIGVIMDIFEIKSNLKAQEKWVEMKEKGIEFWVKKGTVVVKLYT